MPTTKEYKKEALTLSAEEVESILRQHVLKLTGLGRFGSVGKARPVISGGIATPPELSGYSFVIEEGKQ